MDLWYTVTIQIVITCSCSYCLSHLALKTQNLFNKLIQQFDFQNIYIYRIILTGYLRLGNSFFFFLIIPYRYEIILSALFIDKFNV